MRTTIFMPYVMVSEDGTVEVDWCDVLSNVVDQDGQDIPPGTDGADGQYECDRLDAILGTGNTQADKLRRLADYLDSRSGRIVVRLDFGAEAIREHYDGCDPDPTEGMTDSQLDAAGAMAAENFQSDSMWELFHTCVSRAVRQS